jgi:eukaryotic-like serine/threonine-protein kinase
MPLEVGARLGAYEIVSRIGAGGMGEVWKARDTRLNRSVAIKVIDASFSERFEREARAIAALNHPHICQIYDVGPDYLVMEHIDGKPLKGPLPLDKAVGYALQICEALETAHAKGIIHRDLKPSNILVTKSGVKLVDFGLAKEQSAAALEETRSLGLTAAGEVVGTPQYMAPEQIRGREVDARTDIFAFGCVFYELITGVRAFRADSVNEAMAAVLEREPEPAVQIQPKLTPELAHVLDRCLAKDPAERWQTAADLRRELGWAVRTAPGVAEGRRLSWLPWSLAALALVLSAGQFLWFRTPPSDEMPVRFSLPLPGTADLTLSATASTPVPSPEGSRVAFAAVAPNGRTALWFWKLEAPAAVELAGTEDASAPFWKADGRWIGFYSEGKLKKIDPSGGPPQTIAQLPGFVSGAWNRAGDIVFSAGNRTPLSAIDESGKNLRQLTRLDLSRAENSHRAPVFLPDGRHFLFTARSSRREMNAFYAGSLDSPEVRRITEIQSNAFFVPPRERRAASLLYVLDGTLVRQDFDQHSFRLSGQPEPVVQNVAYVPASILAAFQVSADGRLIVFRQGLGDLSQLEWFSREGKSQGPLGPPTAYSQPHVSPDGAHILVSRPDDRLGTRDVWAIETARGNIIRLTAHAANDWFPIWAPKGHRIFFASDRAGAAELSMFELSLANPEGTQRAVDTAGEATPSDVSPDGRWLLLTRSLSGVPGVPQLLILPANGGGKPVPVVLTNFSTTSGRFSPDGRWLVYVSDESGRYEVYLRPFDTATGHAGGKTQVSTGGGDFPVWGRDAHEVFFLSADLQLYTVPIPAARGVASLPAPKALFRPCAETGLRTRPMRGLTWLHPYDVASDGRRLIFNCVAAASRENAPIVLLNFPFGSK